MEGGQEPQESLRGLNDRLRGFLEHVAQLQRENHALQERLVAFGQRSGQQDHEWTMKERAVVQLREQISRLLIENAELALNTENTRSRVTCLQSRCEVEKTLRLHLEQRVSDLMEKKTDMDMANNLLEKQLHTFREELLLLEEEQERELFLQQQQADGLLAAQAAAEEEDGRGMELRRPRPSPRPAPGLRPAPPTRIRKDTAVPNGDATPQVSQGDEALREARAELTEVRKRWHSLQVEVESLHALERSLQSSLRHTQHHYSQQLQDLSHSVRGLEAELEDVRDGLAAQRQQHGQLLNTKMRLEREIATYRRLLEHEEGRFFSADGQPRRLKPWRGSTPLLQQNGMCNGSVEDGDPPALIEKPAKQGATLRRQGSLVILTEPISSREGEICTVKTQEILDGQVLRESAEGHGRVETEKIDKVIKQWEGSFFKGNPKLRKKSVSLRFDLHMAVADEGCAQTKQDSLPDVEVRLVMKRSRSIPTITQ
ncbi:keratin-like protein KRT222 [Astyanax mexicanus]|uniref:Keratin 222 n=1 Tax=Astyanax mexicanus TaxID=7994 RepID=A0A8B9JN25_ASTMX|nr:keratin-like protein KRT222 [Astyanax mexicanus]